MAAKKKTKKVVKRTKVKPRPRRVVLKAPPPPATGHSVEQVTPPDASKWECVSHNEGPEWNGYAEWISELNHAQLQAVVIYEMTKAYTELGAVPDLSKERNSDLIAFATLYARARHEAGDAITDLSVSVFDYYQPAFDAEMARLEKADAEQADSPKQQAYYQAQDQGPHEPAPVGEIIEAIVRPTRPVWEQGVRHVRAYLYELTEDFLDGKLTLRTSVSPFDVLNALTDAGSRIANLLVEVSAQKEEVSENPPV